MKRISFVAIIIIIAMLLSACTYNDSPVEASTPQIPDTTEISPQVSSSTVTPNSMATETDETAFIQECMNMYYTFLSGEINASNYKKDGMYDIDDCFEVDENNNRYTFFDSNHNGIPELHLSSMRYYTILECVNDNLETIYDGSGYETLLDNGGILYTRYGGAPDHISYKYTELDSDNNIYQTAFEKYNGDMEGDYDYFLLDGEEVTKSEFDEKTEKYLNIGSDGIIWSNY